MRDKGKELKSNFITVSMQKLECFIWSISQAFKPLKFKNIWDYFICKTIMDEF